MRTPYLQLVRELHEAVLQLVRQGLHDGALVGLVVGRSVGDNHGGREKCSTAISVGVCRELPADLSLEISVCIREGFSVE